MIKDRLDLWIAVGFTTLVAAYATALTIMTAINH